MNEINLYHKVLISQGFTLTNTTNDRGKETFIFKKKIYPETQDVEKRLLLQRPEYSYEETCEISTIDSLVVGNIDKWKVLKYNGETTKAVSSSSVPKDTFNKCYFELFRDAKLETLIF